MTYKIIQGDALKILRRGTADVVDAIVTDPPAGIGFMGKEWDKDRGGADSWIEWLQTIMEECLRVLKPGGHALIWALPRTSHWTATAVERAGFEIRDVITHHFGSGFPKSHNVGKKLDDWCGWGTALKPATENWILARKPFKGSVAKNVLEHGTGAINIDGCRVGSEQTTTIRNGHSGDHGCYGHDNRTFKRVNPPGRFPANLILSHGDECGDGCQDGCPVAELDGQSGITGASRFFYTAKPSRRERNAGLDGMPEKQKYKQDGSGQSHEVFGSGGDEAWRAKNPCYPQANNHPTVKPVNLMRYLCRLITPPGGTVLDPFAGSGTTGVAAIAEGFRPVLIEAEAEYVEIIRARLEHAVSTKEAA